MPASRPKPEPHTTSANDDRAKRGSPVRATILDDLPSAPANDDVDALMGEVHTMLESRLRDVELELRRLTAERDAILVRLECVEDALGVQRTRRPDLLGGKLRSATDLSRLSDREQEVFNLIGRGGSTRDIADQLGVQQTTVETYIRRIRAKLDLDSFHELRYVATVWLTTQAQQPRRSEG